MDLSRIPLTYTEVAPRMTALHEHLGQLVRYAPPGTLIPVDSLAELLRVHTTEPERPSPAGLSLGEVAERFARVVDGQRKTPQEGTVRKWIRVGLRGVKLKAFRAGRNLRVMDAELDAFVRALTEVSSAPEPAPVAVSSLPPVGEEPEAELEGFLSHYRHDPRGLARGRTRDGSTARSAHGGRMPGT